MNLAFVESGLLRKSILLSNCSGPTLNVFKKQEEEMQKTKKYIEDRRIILYYYIVLYYVIYHRAIND